MSDKENKLKLNISLTFSDGGEISRDDQEEIIRKVLLALIHECNAGDGLAPDEAEYFTEIIEVCDDENHGDIYDLLTESYL